MGGFFSKQQLLQLAYRSACFLHSDSNCLSQDTLYLSFAFKFALSHDTRVGAPVRVVTGMLMVWYISILHVIFD